MIDFIHFIDEMDILKLSSLEQTWVNATKHLDWDKRLNHIKTYPLCLNESNIKCWLQCYQSHDTKRTSRHLSGTVMCTICKTNCYKECIGHYCFHNHGNAMHENCEQILLTFVKPLLLTRDIHLDTMVKICWLFQPIDLIGDVIHVIKQQYVMLMLS